jgi:hypothetical protein
MARNRYIVPVMDKKTKGGVAIMPTRPEPLVEQQRRSHPTMSSQDSVSSRGSKYGKMSPVKKKGGLLRNNYNLTNNDDLVRILDEATGKENHSSKIVYATRSNVTNEKKSYKLLQRDDVLNGNINDNEEEDMSEEDDVPVVNDKLTDKFDDDSLTTNNENNVEQNNIAKTPEWEKSMRTCPPELDDIEETSPNDSDMTSGGNSQYMDYCEANGLKQSGTDLMKQVTMIIDQRVWNVYKLPDIEDYIYGSAFSNKILRQLNLDTTQLNRKAQEMWSRIMPIVKTEYQITRSTVTQAMKQNFFGKAVNSLSCDLIFFILI